MAQLAGRHAHTLDVGGRLHERLAHNIDSVPQSELEAPAIVVREGGDTELEPGQVDALARADLASDDDAAANVRPGDRLDLQVHEAVVHEQAVARLHDAR